MIEQDMFLPTAGSPPAGPTSKSDEGDRGAAFLDVLGSGDTATPAGQAPAGSETVAERPPAARFQSPDIALGSNPLLPAGTNGERTDTPADARPDLVPAAPRGTNAAQDAITAIAAEDAQGAPAPRIADTEAGIAARPDADLGQAADTARPTLPDPRVRPEAAPHASPDVSAAPARKAETAASAAPASTPLAARKLAEPGTRLTPQGGSIRAETPVRAERDLADTAAALPRAEPAAPREPAAMEAKAPSTAGSTTAPFPDTMAAELASNGSGTARPATPDGPILLTGAQAPGAGPVQSAPVIAAPATPAPAAALVTAPPGELSNVITNTLAGGDDRPDRIIVQLDPPELGRVSIDFRFDAQGLQHVTITGDSPEALRQLRLMHFELLQALERQGLAGNDMTFRQDSTHNPHNGAPREGQFLIEDAPASDLAAAPATLHQIAATPRLIHPGGLDIRL